MKLLKRILLVTLLVTAGSLLIACSSKKDNTAADTDAGTNPTTGAALPEVVNIGVIAGGPESAILVQEKYLEQLGVKVNVINYSAGTDINNAIVSGDVDLACFGASPISLGIANGIPYKAVFVSYLEGGNIEALVVKKDAGVSSVADLKGKTIAAPFGTTSHYALLNALELAGVNASDVSLLDMGGEDIVAAWSRGDIDAAYIWSPAQDELVKNDGVIITTMVTLLNRELPFRRLLLPELNLQKNIPRWLPNM